MFCTSTNVKRHHLSDKRRNEYVLRLYIFLFFRFMIAHRTTKFFYKKKTIVYLEISIIIERIHKHMQVLMHVLTRVIIWFFF